MSDDDQLTVGEFANYLEKVYPDWVPMGNSMKAQYHATIEVDLETGEWQTVKSVD